MKIYKFLSLMLLCLVLPLAALAAELPAGVSAMIEAKYPGYAVAAQAGGGNANQGQLALILARDGHNVLCIAEKTAGDAAYAFTVQNRYRRAPGRRHSRPADRLRRRCAVLHLFMIPITTTATTPKKRRTAGATWTSPKTSQKDRASEETVSMQGDRLLIGKTYLDENDNLTWQAAYIPLYTPWLEAAFRLAAFDITAWDMNNYNSIFMGSAQTILGNEYTVSDAVTTPYMLLADAADAQGVRFLFIMEPKPGGSYAIMKSAPLSENVRPEFSHAWRDFAIRIYPDFNIMEDYRVYGFDKHVNGLWYLGHAMASNDFFSYTAYGLMTDSGSWLVGDYPEVELATADWASLPANLAQAKATLDPSGWARVICDTPENRLHLRTAPETNAASLGKYYQGTPVRVLGQSGDWTEVDVFGVHGYMMTKWLVFGADMNGIENAFPQLQYQEEVLQTGIGIYASPWDNVPFATLTAHTNPNHPVVIGIIGDDWYHVLFPETGLSGYIRQDALWAGEWIRYAIELCEN